MTDTNDQERKGFHYKGPLVNGKCAKCELDASDCKCWPEPDAPAREWWIANEPNGKNISNTIDLFTATKVKPENPPWTHVIEHAAYLALKEDANKRYRKEASYDKSVSEIIQELDGVVAVNLTEPSDGDLKHLYDAYHSTRDQLTQANARIAELLEQISAMEDYASLQRRVQADFKEREQKLVAALENIANLTADGRQDMRTHNICKAALKAHKGAE